MVNQNYVPRSARLLKGFDKSVSRVRHVLIARYGEVEAASLLRESRQQYESLIPHIPFIGLRNPMLIFLLPSSRYLAIYLAFKKHGKTLEEVGRLIYEIGDAESKAIPGLVRRFIGVAWFSRWFKQRLKKRALASQKGRYPGGYVFEYIQGDGLDFDYGIDYIECASCKFLDEQSAAELAPYVCAVDKVASETLGWGLRRTMTLAEGGARCDFRFKKGGDTSVILPRSLTGIQPNTA